jgi:hypothetical protein
MALSSDPLREYEDAVAFQFVKNRGASNYRQSQCFAGATNRRA